MSNARNAVLVTLDPTASNYPSVLSNIVSLRTEMFKAGYSHLLGPIQNTDSTVSWVCVPAAIADNTYVGFIRQFLDQVKTVAGATIVHLSFGGFDKVIRVHSATDTAINGQVERLIT